MLGETLTCTPLFSPPHPLLPGLTSKEQPCPPLRVECSEREAGKYDTRANEGSGNDARGGRGGGEEGSICHDVCNFFKGTGLIACSLWRAYCRAKVLYSTFNRHVDHHISLNTVLRCSGPTGTILLQLPQNHVSMPSFTCAF